MFLQQKCTSVDFAVAHLREVILRVAQKWVRYSHGEDHAQSSGSWDFSLRSDAPKVKQRTWKIPKIRGWTRSQRSWRLFTRNLDRMKALTLLYRVLHRSRTTDTYPQSYNQKCPSERRGPRAAEPRMNRVEPRLSTRALRL